MKLSIRAHVVKGKLIPAFLGAVIPVLLLLVVPAQVLADDSFAPMADFLMEQNGQTVTFTDTSTDPDNQITERYWDLGDGTHTSMDQTVEHTYQAGGTYQVTLEVVDETGLRNSVTQEVIIEKTTTPPEAYFYFGVDGYKVTFWDSSSDADGNIVWYYWDLGDGTHLTNELSPAHTYEYTGTYHVRLVITDNDGQISEITRDVVIYDDNPVQPTADFSHSANYNELTFTDTSVDNGREIAEWYWDLGDGTHESMVQQVTHTYNYGGTYTVTLEVVNILGQRNTVEKQVTVEGPQHANPLADFNYNSSDNITFTFNDLSSSTNGNITERYWDLGDGTHAAMEPEISHTYNRGGSYTVKLEVVDELGLRDAYEKVVNVAQDALTPPEAGFTEYIADGAYSAEFYDQSSATSGEITEWYWDLGDGTHLAGEPNITHTYQYNGTYVVKLEVVDSFGSRDTIEKQFTILGESKGAPEAYFTFYNNTENRTVTFYDNSSSPNGAITERYWDLGDGTFATGDALFEHTYQEPGVYTVVLEVVDILGERNTYQVEFEIV
jgi:PKD repeat protein